MRLTFYSQQVPPLDNPVSFGTATVVNGEVVIDGSDPERVDLNMPPTIEGPDGSLTAADGDAYLQAVAFSLNRHALIYAEVEDTSTDGVLKRLRQARSRFGG